MTRDGELSRDLDKEAGPGRGKKMFGRADIFKGKRAALKAAGISTPCNFPALGKSRKR